MWSFMPPVTSGLCVWLPRETVRHAPTPAPRLECRQPASLPLIAALCGRNNPSFVRPDICRMPVILRGPQHAAAWLSCKGAEVR